MVYVFSTCKCYFSFILSAVNRESTRQTKLQNWSRERRWFTFCTVSSFICSGVASKMVLRFFCEVICPHPKMPHAVLYCPIVNGSRVTWYVYRLYTQGGYPRRGYKYDSILASNRLQSLFQFVWDFKSQSQKSCIGRARGSGPACLIHHYCAW